MRRGKVENLKPSNTRTMDERREIAKRAGIASGRKRRMIRDWRELAKGVLTMPLRPGKVVEQIKSVAEAQDKNIDAQMAIVIAQAVKAMKGDAKAAELMYMLTAEAEKEAAEAPPQIPDDTRLIIPAFDWIKGDIKRHSHTHYWMKGGRGSTKSSFISIQIPLLIMANPEIHAVVTRKVANTLKNSVYAQMEWAISELGLYEEFEFKKSPLEITYKRTGQKILFMGVDDKAKIKSLKVPFGYVGIVWYEELDQFAGMEEIRSINQSLLRGGEMHWCFYSFNPPKSKDNWVNVEQLTEDDDRLVSTSNYTQVPQEWLGDQFILEAEKLKSRDEMAYRHEYMGEVTGTGGVIFTNMEEGHFSEEDIKNFDHRRYGLDFGFARDPLAFVCMHYDKKHERLYIFDEIYELGLMNKPAAEKIKEKTKDDSSALIWADSAEPKSIAEMKRYGLFIQGAKKTPDSVDYGIRWLQSLDKIIIDKKRCPNAYREFANYEYERTKDGLFISAYPDKNNHTIDAVRYGLGKDMPIHGRFAGYTIDI